MAWFLLFDPSVIGNLFVSNKLKSGLLFQFFLGQPFFEACAEDAVGDPAFIVHALNVIARATNMSQLARDTVLTREGLYKALSSEGNPAFSTVAKVAKALGF